MNHAKISNHAITGLHGKPILLDACYVNDAEKKPVVIFCHGFKGFKDWGHFNRLAEMFADEGFLFVKFNFSHNGTTPEKPDQITDLDAFGNNNFIKELDDLKCVIDFVTKHPQITAHGDPQQICLIGHSRGGAIAILKAHEDARVKKLATWAAVHDITSVKKRTLDTCKRDGAIYAKNARTGQELPIYYQHFETILANTSRLNVINAAKKVTIPFLIVHGDQDEAVDVNSAEALSKAAPHARLLIVPSTGHTFGVSHPFTGSRLPAPAETVLRETISFLRQ
jgi:uncharacterized protein